jgi:putative PIN family toxin of toxin-antitoxin system
VNKLKIILDTNVLLVSISSKSQYHWIFQQLLNNLFDLYISNEILMEYEEVISLKFNPSVAKNIIRTLLTLPNVQQVTVYYKWNLIQADRDDNKFVDCAITAGADYIVTKDKHFNILEKIDFPSVTIANIHQFKLLII